VTAPEFHGTIVSMAMDVYLPAMMAPQLRGQDFLSLRSVPMLWGIGRLRDGVSIDAAASEADVLSARLATLQPERQIDQRATVIPMWKSPFGAQTYLLPAIALLSAMGALLLLIVCANVSNLVLVRGVSAAAERSRRGRRLARAARDCCGCSSWRAWCSPPPPPPWAC
jgi:hypothetical protein